MTYPRTRFPKAALKVPEITAWFWIIKLLSTAMGESTSDFLVFHIDPYVAVVLGTVGLIVSVGVQMLAPYYFAPIYWFAVVMIAVFGTMVADVLHVVIGIPYAVSTLVLSLGLAATFLAWRRTEGTLSIHSIVTTRRELFYWATVIATFALGTAAGDLVASTFGLGYGAAAVLFAIAFVVPAIGWRWLGWNAIGAFWAAYVITRPLGASIADWLGKSTLGGLGFGDEKVAIVLGILIVGSVWYVARTGLDVAPEAQPA
jgi:uncharacterized membrane-anchored protein